MYTLLYGRTSQDNDDSFSVSSQIDAGKDYATSNNIDILNEYVFREDYSGKYLERPEMNRIRQLVRTRKVRALIIYSVDRLARKVSVGEILLDELLEYNVELHIVRWGSKYIDTPENRLRFNFELSVSGFEHGIIKERTTRGRNKKANSGFMLADNRPMYGYEYNELRTNYVLSEQAPIARRILLEYGIEHRKVVDIVKWLREEGHETPGTFFYNRNMATYNARLEEGLLSEKEYQKRVSAAEKQRGFGVWTSGMVYRVCSAYEAYAGTFRFTLQGKEYSVQIPALITVDEAEEVKQALATGKSRVQRTYTPNHTFLLSGRLHCGDCRKHRYIISFNKRGYCYYRCFGKDAEIQVCTAKPLPRDTVDNATKQFIRDLLLNPRRLFRWWEEQQEASKATQEEAEARQAQVKRLLEDAQAKYHRILDRLTDNLDRDEVAYYTQQKEQCKALIDEYREELSTIQGKLVTNVPAEELISDFSKMGEEYRYALENSDNPDFWKGLVQDLDITATTGHEEGRRYIEFTVFGKTRKRIYLTTEPSNTGAEQSQIDFGSTRAGKLYLTYRVWLDVA